MIEHGAVHDIRSVTDGTYLQGNAALGSTTITVEDAGDFEEDGGSLAVTSLDTDGVTPVTTPYDYTSIDYDTETITLAVPLAVAGVDGDRVDVWPLAPRKQAVVVLTDTADAVTAEVTHALMDLLPEGIREEGDQEFVTVELDDSNQWTLTNVLGKEPAIQSQNYDESAQGWLMDAESTQFQNVNVTESLGVDGLAANSVSINGQDLMADVIDARPLGIIAQAQFVTGTVDSAAFSAQTTVLVFTANGLTAGRVYRIWFSLPVKGTVTNDLFATRLYYTTDGTTPSNTVNVGGIMDGSSATTAMVAGQNVTMEHAFFFTPTADIDTFKIALALFRLTGTGTATVTFSNTNFGLMMAVEDCGPTANVTGSIAQKSKATGTVDVDPVTTYTRTYWATDSQSYDQDGGKRQGDANTPDMYQGYYSGTHGRTFSLAYYDSAQMQKDLAGATIKSCKMTFRVKHAYYNAGVHVRVGLHNQSTPQTTQGEPNTVYGSRDNCTEGSTYTVDLTTGFGNSLRDGTARGTVFFSPGNNALTHYGYMYGATSLGSRPRITITYSK